MVTLSLKQNSRDDPLADDSSDDDYIASLIKTLQATGNTGSPMKQSVAKLTRATSYSKKLAMELSSSSGSDEGGDEQEIKLQLLQVVHKGAGQDY